MIKVTMTWTCDACEKEESTSGAFAYQEGMQIRAPEKPKGWYIHDSLAFCPDEVISITNGTWYVVHTATASS